MLECRFCKAPNTNCPYWNGTFCVYDLLLPEVISIPEKDGQIH